MQPLAIYCREASFGYPGHAVLQNITLTLPAASLVALTGDNGSGKSTLLSTLSGLQPLLSGELGFDFGDTPARKPRIGIVSQRDKLDDLYLFSGYDVVLAGAHFAALPGKPVGKEAHARVETALAQTGAAGFARRRFSELSGGQRQRVLLARALVLQPDVLALDEPVSGVDASSLEHIATLLEALHKAARMTILLASHDPALVARLATHRVHLSDGTATITTLK
ncbi:MAG: ATP-binding cassette domain-containing protein [Puniceicoccales bacterium]|jgi:ABC-type Mn2+/Zn2+ transport system ATPase subunit|nr:ATP-binding cassette domain-containing protein [Puniceicoccales bacterium]